ncbi:sigma-70 family RNA polymerase sigma factor [Tautonia plasticadhaerens]|uniref:ECF RNA polymerase sigma factor SigE n=1 Tax=Tautonia plasticadhaerens TaxID=2527974 RepID=A0A518HDW8_9BACT|nr:sigma-70 family RNA polymerase sigma factor [Tautonia plasticadhaerens]QDV39030.1 ECF RNA polymerase sigma factor SigE [Tautonia plasticadhaerens]
MAIDRDGRVLRALRDVFESGSLAGLSDRELLERAARRGEPGAEAAFSCLVGRHGPMVLRACRARLPDPNDAEDAFQRVFCLLATRARSLWVRDSLGPWLLQVALRVASGTRSEASRRRVFERRYAERASLVVPPDRGPDDLGPMLLEEVGRLPDRDRSVVVLCDLEGLTHEEAAHRLGWPIGTVKSRQSRARDRLRRRLLLRGVAPGTVGSVAPLFGPKFAPAAVPRPLLERSVRSALESAAASSPAWGPSLVAGALTMMSTHRIASVTSGLLLLGAAAVGVGTMVPQDDRASVGGVPRRPSTGSPNVKSVQLPRVDDYLAPDDEWSTLSPVKDPDAARDWQSPPVPESIPVTAIGTAIDTAGRPVAGATVLMMFWGEEFKVLSRTITDQTGAYRFEDVPVPVEQFPEPAREPEVSPSTRFEIVATCPGYGLSWSPQQSMYAIDPPHPLDIQDRLPLGEPVTIDLTFRPADSLSGRVVDEIGTPMEEIEVSVHDADLLDVLGRETSRNLNGVWKALPEGIGRATTGPDGRFQIGGLPSEACCRLWVKDPQFEHYGIALYAATTDKPIERHPTPRRSNGRGEHEVYTGDLELTLHTPRKVLVRVVGDDTGEPIPEARVSLMLPGLATGTFSGGQTDAEGTLLLAVPPEEHTGIVADPPSFDSPYIRTYQRDFSIPSGPDESSYELRLNEGFEVLIEATDATTGEPLPDALFWLVPTDNPDDLRELRPSTFYGDRPSTGPDGRLRAVLAPEAGQEYRLRFAGIQRPNYPAFQFHMYTDRPEYRVEPAESQPFKLVSGGSVRFTFEVKSLPE